MKLTPYRACWKYLILLLILSVNLAHNPLKSQDISTVREIYNFEISDIFHFNFYGSGPGYGDAWITNIEIIGKYYSQNNDTLNYIRDIAYKASSSVNPNWTYKYYVDTVYYTNLDLLINSGNIDSVYTDSNYYNERIINYIAIGIEDVWYSKYVVGCGYALRSFVGWGSVEEFSDELVYYKKGDEEWGTKIPVSVEEDKVITSSIIIYPNPARNKISISNKNGEVINSIIIYNHLGQKVFYENELTNAVDISILRQGMYVVELVSTGIKTREKLIINK